MAFQFNANCALCNGNGLTEDFGGSLIRCEYCFGVEAAAADRIMVKKFDADDIADRFDEDEYDRWRAKVDADMRRDPVFATEDDRRKAAVRQRSLEIQRQTAERLAKIF